MPARARSAPSPAAASPPSRGSARRSTRIRCSGRSWMSRPASAATACPASSCRAKALLDRNPSPDAGRDRRGAGQASVPLRRASAHPARGGKGRRRAACRERAHERHAAAVASRTIAGWTNGCASCRTARCELAVGKVELGQGNVTALAQIAAEELDVDLDRIAVLSGDTQDAPDEGQTTSSQSIEVSGRSVRLVTRGAARAHARPAGATAELQPGGDQRRGRRRSGAATRRPATTTGTSPRPRTLRADITGTRDAEAAHGLSRGRPAGAAARPAGEGHRRRASSTTWSGPDMLHARVLRQPCRGAQLVALDEARGPPRRRRRVPHRAGRRLRRLRRRRTRPWCSAPPPPRRCTRWENVRQLTPDMQEAAWLVGAGSRTTGCWYADPPAAGDVVQASYSRPYHRARLDRPVLRAGGIPRRPSVGLVAHPGRLSAARRAGQRAGHDGRRHHRAARARRRLLRPQRRRRRGGGRRGDRDANCPASASACSGGARRSSGSSRSGPAMHVTRARGAGRVRESRRTGRRRSGRRRMCSAPSTGGNMLTHEALPHAAARSAPHRSAGGERRRRHAQRRSPLYDFPTEAGDPPSGAAPAGAHLGAARAGRAAQRVRASSASWTSWRSAPGSIRWHTGCRCCPIRAPRRLIENVAAPLRLGGARAGRQRARAGLGLGALQEPRRLCRGGGRAGGGPGGAAAPRLVRRRRRPGDQSGRRAQPVGGRHRAGGEHDAEGAGEAGRATGVASLDWESYPILRFSEVPEIETEIIHAPDLPTLGMGECTIGADRGGDRQRRGARAGHAHPRHAVHPRAHRRGAAAGVRAEEREATLRFVPAASG